MLGHRKKRRPLLPCAEEEGALQEVITDFMKELLAETSEEPHGAA